MRSRRQASKSTQVRVTRVFFLPLLLSCSFDAKAQISTGLLFYVYFEIHQVRIPVFDNYQTCTVPLNQSSSCCRHNTANFVKSLEYHKNDLCIFVQEQFKFTIKLAVGPNSSIDPLPPWGWGGGLSFLATIYTTIMLSKEVAEVFSATTVTLQSR